MESLAIILKIHTPEELILYSNIAHWIEGAIFLIVAFIAIIQALGYWKNKQYLWPSLILGAGLFLPIFSYIHHLDELRLAWQATIYDPQQRQHMFMALLMIVAGIGELTRIKRQESSWRFALPAVLAVIGILFLTHPQHGTSDAVVRATIIHNYLGIVLVLAGLFRSIEVYRPNKSKWLAFSWIFFLIIASILLISYREPEGAYETNMPTIEQHME